MDRMIFKKQLENLATQQGINSARVDAVVNTYTINQIQNILEKYGYRSSRSTCTSIERKFIV